MNNVVEEITLASVVLEHPDEETDHLPIKPYLKRWVIITVVAVATALKSYSQSCFGIINDVWCKYYNVEPWQVDWFVVIQSAMYFGFSIPLAILGKRCGFRITTCITIGGITTAYVMTAIGVVTRKGFAVVLVGQAVMGVSSVLIAALAPAAAAIWFPASEVSFAVALTQLSKGVGDCLGSITPPFVVTIDMSVEQVILLVGLISLLH